MEFKETAIEFNFSHIERQSVTILSVSLGLSANHVYMNSWTPFSCELVFKCEFYLKIVSFDIRANHHVEYGIKWLRLCGRAKEGATYRFGLKCLDIMYGHSVKSEIDK